MGQCIQCHRENFENTDYIHLTLHMDIWSHRRYDHRVKSILSLCCQCAMSRDFQKVTVVVPYRSPPLPQDGTAHCCDLEPPHDFWPDLEPPDDPWYDPERRDNDWY